MLPTDIFFYFLQYRNNVKEIFNRYKRFLFKGHANNFIRGCIAYCVIPKTMLPKLSIINININFDNFSSIERFIITELSRSVKFDIETFFEKTRYSLFELKNNIIFFKKMKRYCHIVKNYEIYKKNNRFKL